jgi:Flp pilus assembly secretin CpaC
MLATVMGISSMVCFGQEQAARPDPVSILPPLETVAEKAPEEAPLQPVKTRAVGALPQVLVQIKAFEVSLTKLDHLGKDLKSLGCRNGVVSDAAPLLQTMKALARDGVIESVSEPELVTVVGEPAKYHIGGKVDVPKLQEDGATVIEKQPYGKEVELTADILKDQTIHMAFRMRLSNVTSEVKPVGEHLAPVIEATECNSTFDMESGQTTIIEGTISKRAIATLYGVPVLSDIPAVGELFRYKETTTERRQMIYLVRAEIASPDAKQAAMATRASQMGSSSQK